MPPLPLDVICPCQLIIPVIFFRFYRYDSKGAIGISGWGRIRVNSCRQHSLAYQVFAILVRWANQPESY